MGQVNTLCRILRGRLRSIRNWLRKSYIWTQST